MLRGLMPCFTRNPNYEGQCSASVDPLHWCDGAGCDNAALWLQQCDHECCYTLNGVPYCDTGAHALPPS